MQSPQLRNSMYAVLAVRPILDPSAYSGLGMRRRALGRDWVTPLEPLKSPEDRTRLGLTASEQIEQI